MIILAIKENVEQFSWYRQLVKYYLEKNIKKCAHTN